MERYILKEIKLDKDNSIEQSPMIMSYFDSTLMQRVDKEIPYIKDVSCDFAIKINVQGYYTPEELKNLWQAFSTTIERLNQGVKFGGYEIRDYNPELNKGI